VEVSVGKHSTAARVAAPVAFLLAVTIAVLLVRAGLSDAEHPDSGVAVVTTAKPAFHAVASGDTLASIALQYGAPVEVLRDLNPGIDPVSLEVGSRIRVR
jgi:LysM repeat protein